MQDAVAKGAKVELGGSKNPSGPNFYEPTLLTGINASMEIASTEIFGPVVSIIK